MNNKPFDPLDKESIYKSLNTELFEQPNASLNSLEAFEGAGVYAIFYNGEFRHYKYLDLSTKPIYVGKAVPPGSRTGGGSPHNKALFKRIKEHEKSLNSVSNLELHNFYVKYLVVEDHWIPTAETMLIKNHKPIWNTLIDGFGNHNPGKGRYKGQKSWWDILHPGRPWAEKLINPSEEEQQQFFRNLQSQLTNKAW